jgi:hypothetical protein
MNRLAAIGVLLIASVLPASATEWMICSDGDKASIRVLLGQLDVIAVIDIEITVGKKTWSTKGNHGATLITKGQAFETADQILIDVTDSAVNAIVARLRLFKASEGKDYVSGGTLQMAGEGAWAVTCSGP